MKSRRCSVVARLRGDQLDGTAPPGTRYLLVEDPGPWDGSAHPTGTLPAPLAQSIRALCDDIGARLLLVRRHGRQPESSDDAPTSRRWALVDTVERVSRWGLVDSSASGIDLDEGELSTDRMFLVCTHGRHDMCCAIDGRPVAAALTRHDADATWESSHTGGDRFAANLLVLPDGLLFGRVSPGSAAEIVDGVRDGRVDLTHIRGRVGTAPAAQVAEGHVRRLISESALHGVRSHVVTRDASGRTTVEVAIGPMTWDVLVDTVDDRLDEPLTCRGVGPGVLRRFVVVSADARR